MIHTRNLDEEVAFTSDWWSRTVKDEAKLIKWLQKLQQTEIGGFDDWNAYADTFKPDERTLKIISNIADDELKHSCLIVNLLNERGFHNSLDKMPSQYWDTMNTHIVDLETAAAVNYFGEALAAFRFEILVEHKETPGDIRDLLRIVLPDEQFHRQTLKRIAGDRLDEFVDHHHRAVAMIRGKS